MIGSDSFFGLAINVVRVDGCVEYAKFLTRSFLQIKEIFQMSYFIRGCLEDGSRAWERVYIQSDNDCSPMPLYGSSHESPHVQDVTLNQIIERR